MREPVRLVIWDLDETFWRGTLTEGGVTMRPECLRIVVELARRGIVSSICSKNEFEPVKRILVEHGVWDYFVVPSLSWAPKAARIQEIVDTVALRPETVLFIDDNASNLQEAKRLIPQLQIADEGVIAGLLDDPLLQGKNDAALTRLQQYKLLERRAEERRAVDDAAAFLRASDIRVAIDYNVEDHLERAVELVNRTNQLNFTKRRLPQDLDEAKAALKAVLSQYNVQAGLVRVRDKYGDHGYCGLYVVRKAVEDTSGLLHFCFSCRILGMGVETWLYRRLGRPKIKITGDVLTDIADESQVIDWITLDDDAPRQTVASARRVSRVRVRGACELMAISHYLNLLAPDMIGEFAFNRDHVQIRIEHSQFLRYALEGVSEEAMASFLRLGLRREDFQTRLFDDVKDDEVWVLGFWGDATYPLYRHKQLGVRIPFNAFPATGWTTNFLTVKPDQIKEKFRDHWVVGALQALQEEYQVEELVGEAQFKDNLEAIVARIPQRAKAFVMGGVETFYPANGERVVARRMVALNAWCRDVVAGRANVEFFDLDAMMAQAGLKSSEPRHFDRRVYFMIYEHILARLASA